MERGINEFLSTKIFSKGKWLSGVDTCNFREVSISQPIPQLKTAPNRLNKTSERAFQPSKIFESTINKLGILQTVGGLAVKKDTHLTNKTQFTFYAFKFWFMEYAMT